MVTDPNDPVDEKLRDAFAVDEAAAVRVAGEALASPPRRGSGVALRAGLALAAVVLCAGLAVWLFRPTVGALPDVPAPPGAVELSGSLIDGVLVVPIPDDAIVIAGPGQRNDRPSDGYGIVLVEGEVR